MLQLAGAEHGKKCLVVGSGKSAVDAVRFLVKQGNDVRCVYRTPTAFVTMAFNGFYARLLQSLEPALYFHYFLNQSVCEAYGISAGWDFDYTLEEEFDQWFNFVLIGEGDVHQHKRGTRGGICRRSEYLLTNLVMRAHGVRADVNDLAFAELDNGRVTCDAFPGEAFDHVVSCSGYMGTKSRLPNCIYALTPLIDMHIQSGWMMGHVIHSLLDDPKATASWNELASLKSDHPWVGHYAQSRAWVAKHRNAEVTEAWDSMRDGLIKSCEVQPSSTATTRLYVLVDSALDKGMAAAAHFMVAGLWRAPRWVSRACLALVGRLLASC